MKKKTPPFVTRLWSHQPVIRVILDQPFDSIDQRAFPNLRHQQCNGDEGCVCWMPRRIKRCGVYWAMFLKLHGEPAQPRRYPIKWIELRPHKNGQQTLVLWRGGVASLVVLKAILRHLGLAGAVVGPVTYTQLEMFGTILHDDLTRALIGIRKFLGCKSWGLHVLRETTPGTLHKVKAAWTHLEGELILTEITRVLKGKKCPTVELVVYHLPKEEDDTPDTRKKEPNVKVEVVIRVGKGDEPFTQKERKKLEKITAGFLVVLFDAIGVTTQGLDGRKQDCAALGS